MIGIRMTQQQKQDSGKIGNGGKFKSKAEGGKVWKVFFFFFYTLAHRQCLLDM